VVINYVTVYFAARGARVLTGLPRLPYAHLNPPLRNWWLIGWIVRSFFSSFFSRHRPGGHLSTELRRLWPSSGHPIFSLTTENAKRPHLAESRHPIGYKPSGALIAKKSSATVESGVYEETGVNKSSSDFSVELVLVDFHSSQTALPDGRRTSCSTPDRAAAPPAFSGQAALNSLDRSLGLRHRAGLGITDESYACIVVSEETARCPFHRRRSRRNLLYSRDVSSPARVAELFSHRDYEKRNLKTGGLN